MFNIRRLLDLFRKPWDRTPAPPRIEPTPFNFDLTPEGVKHLLTDGILYVRNQVDGSAILLVCSDIPVMHVTRKRLELTLAMPDKSRIEGDVTTHDVHDLRLWIPDELLAPRFAEWRAADEAARKIGAPTPGRDLHMPGGAVLLCCHLAGNSLDIEGRAPITCRGHMSAEQYEKENPDRFCLTREDGECISPDPRCMHNKYDVDVAIATVAGAEVASVEVVDRSARRWKEYQDRSEGHDDAPCKRCGSDPYDNTRCPSCGPGMENDRGVTFLEKPETDLRAPVNLNRCACCGWPLKELAKDGCVRGNCSQRPLPEHFYDAERYYEEMAELVSR